MHGVYVHIPFCAKRCDYCDFVSTSGKEECLKPYMDMLKREISSAVFPFDMPIGSIFIGGGTPSLLPPEEIEGLMEALHAHFQIEHGAEITMEANPGTLHEKKLHAMINCGINRLSIGAQASQNRLLSAIGRIHTWEDVEISLNLAHKAGFSNINIDLMYGLPGQTLDDYIQSIQKTAALDVTHISAYSLILEEGTRLYANRRLYDFPDDDAIFAMQEAGIEALDRLGFPRYEISNFAKEGYACRHNILYWENSEYLGLGAGAHGRVGNIRYENMADIDAYINALSSNRAPTQRMLTVLLEEDMFDTIMLGTRMLKGIDKNTFFKRFHKNLHDVYGDTILALKNEGLLQENPDRLFLTKRGLNIQNTVLLRFLP